LKAAIVIPTYWTDRAEKPRPGEAVYDHPTVLGESFETLSRCLESLVKLKGEFEVLVLAVPTRMSLAGKVEKRVKEIVKPFRGKLNLKVFYPSGLRRLKRKLAEEGFAGFSSCVSMHGYGNVRNLCLLLPYLSGFDVAVLLDDDELVIDRDFLEKPLESIGRKRKGRFVGGIAGYYVYRGRGYRLKEAEAVWNLTWNKAALMNEAFKVIESRRRLNPASFAFGGCMAIHRKLTEKLPFDPWITRGEDIDYLLCARLYGFEFLLDNQWSILHDPPPKRRGFWGEFEQDVYRFLYQREKLRLLEKKLEKRILDERLDPFPGYFLKDDLEGKILVTGILAVLGLKREELFHAKSLSQLVKAFREVEVLLRKAEKYAFENVGRYLGFQRLWAETLREMKGEIELPLEE